MSEPSKYYFLSLLKMSGQLKNYGWILTALVIIITVLPASGQEEYRQFYSESLGTTNPGMYVLGGWAITNIASGAYGWHRYDGDTKYFHQMNLFWNTVNLSIAGFAIYSNLMLDVSAMGPDEIMKKHLNTEKILLINAGLDVGYIGAGFLMRHLAGRSEKNSDLLKGYGNSVILQGSFLFLLDIVLYGILRTQRYDFLENINVAFISEGAAVRFIIPL